MGAEAKSKKSKAEKQDLENQNLEPQEIEQTEPQEVSDADNAVEAAESFDDKIPLDPELGIDPEELNAELEGLKDLVQDEINKMMDSNKESDWKDFVDAAREEKIASKTAKQGPLCECCGENPVGEDGVYCDSCLETMKHYPFEWWKYIIPVIAIVLVVLSLSFFAISWPVYKQSVEAQHLVDNHKLMSALNKYDEINTEIKVTDNNYGRRYLRKQVELYDTIGVDAYKELDSFIDSHYPSTVIDKPYNKYVKSVKQEINDYSAAYECFSNAANGAKTYEDFLKAYNKEIKGENLNQAMIGYYKYYASLIFNASSDIQKKNVDEIKKSSPNMKSLYIPLYAEIALNNKDYDSVLKYANELADVNSESTYVYLYRTVAYRLKGNINLAYKQCSEGLKLSSTDPLLNYQMSVICLLEGKTKEATNFASISYENANTENSFLSAASIYALCSQLTKDTDTYDNILNEVESYGYTISPDIEKILDNSLKIEDIFTTGRGDFSWE